jgi:hypothetical protein
VKPHETRSTGQGVGGNPESEGPQGKPAGPSESELSPAPPQGRPASVTGKPRVVYGGGVGEAGMWVSSLRGDLVRPSVLRTVDSKAGGERASRYPTGATGPVARAAMRVRRDQGVGWRRSSDDAPGNRRGAKDAWSDEPGSEKADRSELPREGPV